MGLHASFAGERGGSGWERGKIGPGFLRRPIEEGGDTSNAGGGIRSAGLSLQEGTKRME